MIHVFIAVSESYSDLRVCLARFTVRPDAESRLSRLEDRERSLSPPQTDSSVCSVCSSWPCSLKHTHSSAPAFCRAGLSRRCQSVSQTALPPCPLTVSEDDVLGGNLAVTSEPLSLVGKMELGDWLGWTVRDLQLQTAFPSCPWLHIPAVLQRKAPLPPLCIMTNQGRQAAVPLAHHSTVSLPWENKLTELY